MVSHGKVVCQVMVGMLAGCIGVQVAVGWQMPGGGGGMQKKAWSILSPAATDPLAELPNDANVACSGDAEENGVRWECIIQSSLEGQSNNVAGSSANNAWSGTVPKLAQNWGLGNATATPKVMDETEDTNSFVFVQ